MPNDSDNLTHRDAIQNISPEDDATLQAIEALEARSIDENPAPFIPVAAPKPAPVAKVALKPVVAPIEEPEVVPPTPAPAPIVAPPPQVQAPKPTPAPEIQRPIDPPIVHPTPPPKPTVPKKPSEAIAEELENAPAPASRWHPFAIKVPNPKAMKTMAVIIGIILVVGGATFLVISMLPK